MTKVSFPLWLVIIMNINVIIGAGVFVNTRPLAQLAGPLSFLSYFTVACIVLPLVLVVAQLAKMHKAEEGGLYTYSQEGLGTWAGVASASSYFLGKVSSSTLLVKTIVFYLYSLLPFLNKDHSIYIKFIVLALLLFFNMRGMKFSGKLQLGFVVAKLIPIAVVIFGGLYLFKFNNFTMQNISIGDFSSSLPIALFAMMGFETACSIGHMVKNPQKNMSRAVILSFLLVGVIYMVFQGVLFGSVGTGLLDAKLPLGGFFVKLFSSVSALQAVASPFLTLSVMLAIAGSCYGIIFINSWNGYKVAQVLNLKKLTKLNKHGAPAYTILLQGLLIFTLIFFDLNVVTLTRMAILGIITNFILIVLSMLRLYKKRRSEITLPWWIAFASLLSCAYIAFIALKDLL